MISLGKSSSLGKIGKDAKILFCACVIPEKGLIPSIAPPNFDDFVCEDHIALLEKTTKLGGKLTIEFVPICPGKCMKDTKDECTPEPEEPMTKRILAPDGKVTTEITQKWTCKCKTPKKK
jgi:hypothetical protein